MTTEIDWNKEASKLYAAWKKKQHPELKKNIPCFSKQTKNIKKSWIKDAKLKYHINSFYLKKESLLPKRVLNTEKQHPRQHEY